MKKKIIGVVAVLAVLAAGAYLYTIWTAKTAASDAVGAFNAAAQEYNDAIAPYNEAAAGIAEANEALQGVLDEAQGVLDKGEEAYDPDTRKELEKAVKKAGEVFFEVPVLIDPFEMRDVPGSWNKKELAQAQYEAEEALKAVKAATEKIPDVPEVPDYSGETEAVRAALKQYKDSVQKLANVTAPPDAFVKDRLKRIDTVVAVQAVTAEHDPNGLLGEKAGYAGCVYFLDERIDRSLLPQEAFPEEDADGDGDDGDDDGEDADDDGDDGDDETGSDSADGESAGGGETEDTEETSDESAEENADTSSAADAGNTSVTSEEAAAAGTGDTSAAAEDLAAAGADDTADTADTSASAAASAGATEAAAAGTTAEETAASGPEEDKKENAIDVVMIGTAGGGAVEIFATREDAEKRAEYINFFAGSVMDGGACDVEGTCVIRTSKYLDEEQQKKLTKEIRKALLTVDE